MGKTHPYHTLLSSLVCTGYCELQCSICHPLSPYEIRVFAFAFASTSNLWELFWHYNPHFSGIIVDTCNMGTHPLGPGRTTACVPGQSSEWWCGAQQMLHQEWLRVDGDMKRQANTSYQGDGAGTGRDTFHKDRVQ